jgi:hypothetical protein
MANAATDSKFPDGSTTCDYDIFEELPDGSAIWRACVFGMNNVELKLLEMARETNNKVFAVNLQDRSQPVVRPFRWSGQPQAKRQPRRMTKMSNGPGSHFHIRWIESNRLDLECFKTHLEAAERALELARQDEVFQIEELTTECPLMLPRREIKRVGSYRSVAAWW